MGRYQAVWITLWLHRYSKKEMVKEDRGLQQYEASKERVRHLRKTIYKVHPKWKRRRVVRLVLLLIFLACLIVTAVCMLKMPNTDSTNVSYLQDESYKTFTYIGDFIMLELGVCFFPGLIYILYCYVLKGSCRGGIQWKDGEFLILSDTELRNFFSKRGNDSNIKTEISFLYTDIKRIVWNECQQRFEIYGISTRIHYIDYARDKVDARSKNKENIKMPYHIEWVYPIDKLEEFKNELVKATGLQIELKTEATE